MNRVRPENTILFQSVVVIALVTIHYSCSARNRFALWWRCLFADCSLSLFGRLWTTASSLLAAILACAASSAALFGYSIHANHIHACHAPSALLIEVIIVRIGGGARDGRGGADGTTAWMTDQGTERRT